MQNIYNNREFAKKILYLHETAKFSGAEESLLNLAQRLDRSRFIPIFVLPEEGGLARRLREKEIEVNLIGLPKIRKIKGVKAAINKIRGLVKHESIDLIHANSIRTNIYGAIVAKLEGLPVVWHQRNLLTNELVDLDKLFSNFADAIICNSEAIRKRFNSNPKAKVIYNGVDTERFNPGVSGKQIRGEFNIASDELVIGMASRLSTIKGQETFLKAAKIIQGCNIPAKGLKFLIAGDHVFEQDRAKEKDLKDMAVALGLGEQVIFTGFREDMPEIYAAMDIFVLASRSEACGRVILEAMAQAKPMVATNSGGTPEIVVDGKTGLLVRPDEPRELAESLLWLINNPERARDMGRLGRTRIEESFKIEKNVRQIEQVYAQLLYKGGRRDEIL